ncbi:MAG: single-stranded-DNA-specific exonuclease RecJ, partial [Chloroflexi bacterium]|nr:single-stranded-DNA-specific exonuclease RecJ [Chloroflexota bacterium]
MAEFPELPPLVVQLLYNRGVCTRQEVEAFLSRSFGPDNPFSLQGISEAVARLRQAIRAREAVAVYGDYDADGVAATALLVPTLRALGAEASPYIPKRLEEGYGLNEPALAELARQGFRVVVTVDCGVRSVEEAAFARSLGLDLIITDHHAIGSELPAAVAVIDPRRDGDRYPFKQLAGVGLAFKLAQALLRAERQVPVSRDCCLPEEQDLLDLVALGTVADLAPLLGENRALVSRGLEQLNQARRPGIAAMLQEAGLKPGQINATTVGFVLGPRLNAAGRLDDAIASYNLLTTSSVLEANMLAQQLGEQNRQRRQLMNDLVQRARSEIQTQQDQLVYVLADPAYAAGIAGLVASRITEEFYRPSLVIAREEGESRGSARSIEGFHITQALDECHDLLVRHGGHAAAAGFTIRSENIDPLRLELQRIAARELSTDQLVPTISIDLELPLAKATGDQVALLEMLQPFGIGNPRPVFAAYNVQVRDCRSVGSEGTSLKFKLSDGIAVWDIVGGKD